MASRGIRFIVAATAVAGLALTSAPAYATTASATLSPGSLAFVSAPPAVSFSATLNGSDQTVAATQGIDIGDGTGSGAGWNVTATSTTFTSGANTLPATAVAIPSAPSVGCDAAVTCAVATPSGSMTYPYALPAGPTAPTATKLFNATAGTGMGNQTVTVGWRLTVPGDALAGAYSSTWTLSLVSAP